MRQIEEEVMALSSGAALATIVPTVLSDAVEQRIADLHVRVYELALAAKTPSTERSYAGDWANFSEFCGSITAEALPAEPMTIAMYAAMLVDRGLAVATIARRLAAIAKYHSRAGYEPPTRHARVRDFVGDVKKVLRIAQRHRTALLRDPLEMIVTTIPTDLRGLRDRAILLTGWAGAFRRSELAGLDVGNLTFEAAGVAIYLATSKTDQIGAGETRALKRAKNDEMCPVRALMAWCETVGDPTGPLFRGINRHGHIGQRLSAHGVGAIVQARTGHLEGDFGAHSLRSGFATQASRDGVSALAIKRHGGWRSNVVERYIQAGSKWDEAVGLL